MQQSQEYPTRVQRDNLPASSGIPLTTRWFPHQTLDEAPSNHSSAIEYNRNSLR